MTRLPVKRLARAEEDLIGIWLYIAQHSEGAANRWLDKIEARWQLLETQPFSGAPREDIAPGLRHVVVGQYLSLTLSPKIASISFASCMGVGT